MVANGEMDPVGLESVVRATNNNTNVVCVVLARVEIGVVTAEDRETHLGALDGEHSEF